MQKYHRELTKLLERKGVEVLAIGKAYAGSPHPRVVFRTASGGTASESVADTPGAVRSIKNDVSKIVRRSRQQ